MASFLKLLGDQACWVPPGRTSTTVDSAIEDCINSAVYLK